MINKIIVDRNLCIGAASCVIAAGTAFELDAENKAVVTLKGGVKSSGPAERAALADENITDDTLIAAAQSCPTKAIELYDEAGNKIYPND